MRCICKYYLGLVQSRFFKEFFCIWCHLRLVFGKFGTYWIYPLIRPSGFSAWFSLHVNSSHGGGRKSSYWASDGQNCVCVGGESPGIEHKTKIQNNDLQLPPSCSVVWWFYSRPWGRYTQTPEITQAVIRTGTFSWFLPNPDTGNTSDPTPSGIFTATWMKRHKNVMWRMFPPQVWVGVLWELGT